MAQVSSSQEHFLSHHDGKCARKLAVVTGFHNRRELVEASMASILGQTYSDFELIVFDDASTDGTREYLQQIEDPRIRLICNETNRGFVPSLISAIETSNSELIAIHGAGDISYPRRLERQVAYLDSLPSGVAVGCHRDVLTPSGQVVSSTKPGPDSISFKKLLEGNVYSHGEVMYRRQAYDTVGGYRLFMKFAQDYDLWLRMSRLGKMGIVQEVLYGRVAIEGGVSFNADKVVEQAAFSELAKKFATGVLTDEPAAATQIQSEGIHAVVPLTDPEVVRKLRARVRVLLSLGRWDEAYRLAFELLEPDWANPVEINLTRGIIAMGRKMDPEGRGARWLLARARGK